MKRESKIFKATDLPPKLRARIMKNQQYTIHELADNKTMVKYPENDIPKGLPNED